MRANCANLKKEKWKKIMATPKLQMKKAPEYKSNNNSSKSEWERERWRGGERGRAGAGATNTVMATATCKVRLTCTARKATTATAATVNWASRNSNTLSLSEREKEKPTTPLTLSWISNWLKASFNFNTQLFIYVGNFIMLNDSSFYLLKEMVGCVF